MPPLPAPGCLRTRLCHAQAVCLEEGLPGKGAFLEQLGQTCDKAGLVMLATQAQLAMEKLKEDRQQSQAVRGSFCVWRTGDGARAGAGALPEAGSCSAAWRRADSQTCVASGRLTRQHAGFLADSGCLLGHLRRLLRRHARG